MVASGAGLLRLCSISCWFGPRRRAGRESRAPQVDQADRGGLELRVEPYREAA